MHFYIQIHDPPSSLHISNSKSKPVIGPHLPTPGVTCLWRSRQLCSFPCQQHLMCAGLWCLVEGDTSCKTKLDPPLDGTECGADKVTPTSHGPPLAPVSWALGKIKSPHHIRDLHSPWAAPERAMEPTLGKEGHFYHLSSFFLIRYKNCLIFLLNRLLLSHKWISLKNKNKTFYINKSYMGKQDRWSYTKGYPKMSSMSTVLAESS